MRPRTLFQLNERLNKHAKRMQAVERAMGSVKFDVKWATGFALCALAISIAALIVASKGGL